MKGEPKWNWCPVVDDVSGGDSEVQCCKNQYRVETRNVRSKNQGKLDVVKKAKTRVNTDILGISDQKWIWMGELNSTTVGKNPLEEME